MQVRLLALATRTCIYTVFLLSVPSGCGTATESMDSGTPPGSCHWASDCALGTTCVASACVADVPCSSSRTCVGLLCDATRAVCVECSTSGDCPGGHSCHAGVCIEDVPCSSDRDCTTSGALCARSSGVCVECNADVDCTNGLGCGPDQACVPRLDASTGDASADAGLDAPSDSGSDAAGRTCAYATVVEADAPVAYWPLDEVAGSASATDVIGHRRASVVGPVSFGVTALAAGSAARFTGGAIELPFDASLATPRFSIELWARVDSAPGTFRSPLVFRTNDAACTTTAGWALYADTADHWTAWLGDASGCWHEWAGSAPVVVHEALHLVLTYDATTFVLYVNGAESMRQDDAYTPPASGLLRMGASANTDGTAVFPFPGDLDEVGLYDRALSAAQVASHYRAGTDCLAP